MNKKFKPLVSIIISSYNGFNFLPDCLTSIFREKSKRFEVILVDDGSNDNTCTEIRKLYKNEKRLNIVRLSHNVGISKARNIGSLKSHGQYLFFLDNDTKVKCGWLKEIPIFFSHYPKAGLAQPKILKMNSHALMGAGCLITSLGFLSDRVDSAWLEDHGQFNKINKVFSIAGTGIITKKSIFEKLHGFDEDYFFCSEDSDYCWRAWLAGYEVYYLPTITLWHHFGTIKLDTNSLVHKQLSFRATKNVITTLIKNLSWQKLSYILPINISCWIGNSVFALFHCRIKQSINIWRGIIWNLSHIFQVLKKRNIVQSQRKISDAELLLQVGDHKVLYCLFSKIKQYLKLS